MSVLGGISRVSVLGGAGCKVVGCIGISSRGVLSETAKAQQHIALAGEREPPKPLLWWISKGEYQAA